MKRLLVANRGEIARRIIRSAKAMGIATVAVHSDADAGALHVLDADASFALGGQTAAESYLRIARLVAAARATGADAVHPGYGFLSENADFAEAVVDAGLGWVGPPAAAIRALGSKSALKQRAAHLEIPCLPSYAGEDQSHECFAREAQRIGYPVMVKAAAGGGGRGMRLVMQAHALADALRSARSEAESAFGHGELLLERALLAPRHVELQVFADARGHCIHLGERDCSVQRRHQKIIEESPSPAVDAELRERMGACAVRLAQSAGYVGAGTVEFLLDGRDFYLMEMNTRLQVEHPVTEALTGLDLVEWQIRVARGEALPFAQGDVSLRGHAIEVRLCAEDEQFTPHAGTVQRFEAPQGVRMDHALSDGAVVSPHYDSMIGKLIVHQPTRREAIDCMLRALSELRIVGIQTTVPLHREILRHAAFVEGRMDTTFIERSGLTQ
jgi:geranyl-CoA carboxylase alpha subunit